MASLFFWKKKDLSSLKLYPYQLTPVRRAQGETGANSYVLLAIVAFCLDVLIYIHHIDNRMFYTHL